MSLAPLYALRDALRWWADLIVRVWRLDGERRRILGTTLDLLESPAFPYAQTAVRETACVLGFRDPKMWKGLSQRMKETPDHAENVYRHLHADLRTRELSGTGLARPDLNLLVELAYHGFATERG